MRFININAKSGFMFLLIQLFLVRDIFADLYKRTEKRKLKTTNLKRKEELFDLFFE